MAWQDGLHRKQIDAAVHLGSHARLLAGPGTGKTVTLTRRLVKLLVEDGIPSENILAVAFTRINAFDLLRTLKQELRDIGITVPHVSTLHSYALRQLLRNARLITTLPQPLRIADDFEEKNIIRQDLRSVLGLSAKEIMAKFADLSSDWQSLAVEQTGYQPSDPRFMGTWQEHRNLYGYTLRSELVWQLKHAVEENPDNFKFEREIRHLIVDEYQDLNKCDLEIIRKLADLGAEVYCAGDDDQSIYGFRRAHPAGIRRFIDEYKPSIPLALDICWRSDTRIIEVSQHVANQDRHRLPKPIHPRDGAGEGEVHLLRFGEQVQEANGVTLLCSHLLEDLHFAPDEILILLRSDHQERYSEILAHAFQSRGLPFNIRVDSGDILDEVQGRCILSLMRLTVNPNDDLAWRTIFQYSGRQNQIGKGTIAAISEYARVNGLRFHEACYQIYDDSSLIPRGTFVQKEMIEILSMISSLSELAAIDPTSIENEEETSQARQRLMDELSRLCETVIPVQEMQEQVFSYLSDIVVASGSVILAQLLAAITSPEDTLDQELEEGKINILTMHRAKGLSARAVIIVAAEEQLIPGAATGDEVDDARRLLYVSLSRAKEYLFITYCNRRTGRQRHSGSDPGNAQRNLTPFLRGVLPIEGGIEYLRQIGLIQ